MVIYKGSDLKLTLDIDISEVEMIKVYTNNVNKSIKITNITDKTINIEAKDLAMLNSGVIAYDVYRNVAEMKLDDGSYNTVFTVYTDYYYMDTDENGAQHKKVSEDIERYIDKRIDEVESTIDATIDEKLGDTIDEKIDVKAKEIDASIDAKVKVETDRATVAETTNANNIIINKKNLQNEVERAKGVESDLYSQDATIKANLEAETNKRESADAILANDISANTTLIKDETSRAKEAEKTISSNLSDYETETDGKITSLKNADTALEKLITDNTTAINADIATVKGNLSSETARAIAAETSLSNTKANKTDIPTKVSQLTNDSKYATVSEVETKDATVLSSAKSYADSIKVTKTSQLTNDSGFLTQHQDISNLATKTEVNLVKTTLDNTSSRVDDLTEEVYKNSTAITTLNGSDTTDGSVKKALSDAKAYTDTKVSAKQDKLVSGTNIKTINNQSILGSGNIVIDIPTKVSQLTNDSGYITKATSDSTYAKVSHTHTMADITDLSELVIDCGTY